MNKYKLIKVIASLAGVSLVFLINHFLVTQPASALTHASIEPRQATDLAFLSSGYNQTVSPNSVVTFTHVLTNASAVSDSFMLTTTSSHGWPVVLRSPTGALSLPFQLEAGFTTTILLQIAVPSGVVGGTIDSTILTATSQTTYTLFSESIDTTMVHSPTWQIYLPLVLRYRPLPPEGIYGRITYLGTPVSGHQIELELCDRQHTSNWLCTTSQTVLTQLDGSYQFTTATTLGVNQKYEIDFYNYPDYGRGNPSYLGVATGPDILSYTAGQTMPGGTFDVADVPLLEPTDGITTGLPVVFRWTPRVIGPSDSYQVSIWNANDESIYFLSPFLGHVGSYTLRSLPANFTPGTYAWLILFRTSTGYRGASFETRLITFPGTSHK